MKQEESFYCFLYLKYITLIFEKILVTEKESQLQNLGGMSLAPIAQKILVRLHNKHYPFRTSGSESHADTVTTLVPSVGNYIHMMPTVTANSKC